MLYGLMTEEINYAYEGGLYAELIRNRSFKADAVLHARSRPIRTPLDNTCLPPISQARNPGFGLPLEEHLWFSMQKIR